MPDTTLAERRLRHHALASGTRQSAVDVVRRLVAMQAQDYRSALWGVALRMGAATETSVEQALHAGQIVRTWPLRGTLHLVAAQDVRWLLTHVAAHAVARSSTRSRQLGLDAATFSRAAALFRAALNGGNALTRKEMMLLLEQGGIAPDGQRGYHILGRLAQEGVICFGPRAGRQDTFVLLDEWVPEGRALGYEEALAELAQRYFAGHGPATIQDFIWWSGLPARDARTALELASPQLVQSEVGQNSHWSAPTSFTPAPAAPRALLLPAFDEYLLGYRQRDAVLDPAYAHRIVPGGNGMFRPTILIDGHVVGTWKRQLRKKSGTITLEPFHPLAADELRAIAAAARAYGEFLGLPLELRP